jgi:hypothetical protein
MDLSNLLKQSVVSVQNAVKRGLAQVEDSGDVDAIKSDRAAWAVDLKKAVKRVGAKDISSLLFGEYAPLAFVSPKEIIKKLLAVTETLRSDKSLERRTLPWDTVIFVVHVPDSRKDVLDGIELLRFFGVDKDLEVL